jgi:hypothetical protein
MTLDCTEDKIEGVPLTMLKKLYEAKCHDLKISKNNEQEKRFYEFCRRSLYNKKLLLKECGLGQESSKVLGNILRSY